jgi:hypothetical protein
MEASEDQEIVVEAVNPQETGDKIQNNTKTQRLPAGMDKIQNNTKTQRLPAGQHTRTSTTHEGLLAG